MSESISRAELKELLSEVLVEKQEPEVSLADVVRAVQKHGRLALLMGAGLAAVVAFYFFVIITPEYRATSQFLIPLEPEEGEMGQEAYVSILNSAKFADFVRGKMPDELKAKIISNPEDSLDEIVSFTREGAKLSVVTGRGSSLVSVSARSSDAETSAAFANFVSREYISYAEARRNGKLDEDIVVTQAAVDLKLRLFDETRDLLKKYIEANPVLIPGRLITSDGNLLLFDGEGEDPPKQAMESDMEYYEFATSFEMKFEALVELRDMVEQLKLEKELPFRGIEFLREAEVPLENANRDLKKSVLLIALSFMLGFGGWILLRSLLVWVKSLGKAA